VVGKEQWLLARTRSGDAWVDAWIAKDERDQTPESAGAGGTPAVGRGAFDGVLGGVDDLGWAGEAALPGESGPPNRWVAHGFVDSRADVSAAEDKERLALVQVHLVAAESKHAWIQRWPLGE
jgi:hypothetical protein